MNEIKLGENRKGHNTIDNDRPNEFGIQSFVDDWHWVEDALPKDTRPVLTFGSHALPVVGFYNNLWKKWFSYVAEEDNDSYMDYVTHWMPLPKPPVG